MINGIGYIRVSTDRQAKEGLSLQGQKKEILKYCKENNINLVKIFEDAGASAKTINRPEFLKALDFCQDPKNMITSFIVWKSDRFARDMTDHIMVKGLLSKSGVTLRSVTEHFENNPHGNFFENIMAAQNQLDNEVRALRSKNGPERRVEEGGWPYLAPIGYVNQKNEDGKPTLVKTGDAEIIRLLLKEFSKGNLSVIETNRRAIALGLTGRNGRQLGLQQTLNMLNNPLYAGLVKTKSLDEPIKGLHEGLITVAEHHEILRLLGKPNHEKIHQTDEGWPLRGLLICAECEGRMTGSSPRGRSGKRYPKYHCVNCKASIVKHPVSVDREEIHDAFRELLTMLTPTERAIESFKHSFVARKMKTLKAQRSQIASLNKRITELEDKHDKIIEKYVEGKLTDEDRMRVQNKVSLELAQARSEVESIKSLGTDTEILIDGAINLMKNLVNLWDSSNTKNKMMLQSELFPEGLTYNFVEGFGTIKIGPLYEVKEALESNQSNLVGLVGIEPTTKWL